MSDLTTFTKNFETTYTRLRSGLAANPRGHEWRVAQLKALQRLLIENDAAISKAMWQDMHKSPFECEATEQGVVLAEIKSTLKHLKRWMRPRRAANPLYNQLGKNRVVHDPYGLTLIIGAWNYPINLTLAPLVGAIAGGNAALIKPSELSANTAALIADLVPKYLDTSAFAVVNGGKDETGVVLDKPYDLIFFTGSTPVGRVILAKAAPHLTPVVLELGGKSPAVVAQDADIAVSARRIAWGKFLNAGQTCVAPDYILVHADVRAAFVAEMKKLITEFFGTDPSQSPDYCRIINERNFDRLNGLMSGQKLISGGRTDRGQLYIEPTLVECDAEAPVMKEEIFGPILPIITMNETSEILAFINARPKPLALYVFTKDTARVDAFTYGTSSGALCINDNVIHMPIDSVPFGGVGESGMGHYHGRYSFETFTHAKAVVRKSFWFDLPVRYPPYTRLKARILRWLFS